MSRIAYFNGAWIPESELKVSAWDLAVMQGASAFEMCRSFRHVHFKLREHLDRLRQSCHLLNIPLPTDFDRLEEMCAEVTARNPMPLDQEHRLLIVVSPGCAPMYHEIDGVIPHSYLYVATFPLRYTVKGFSKYFTEGVHCVTSQIQQVPDACIPSSAKHRSRLHFHLAQMQAPPGTWPILLARDPDIPYVSNVAEAPGANLAIVIDGKVSTLKKAALHGISLQTVKDLTGAQELYPVDLADLLTADELWLTGTPFCALSVVSLDGEPIGDGKPGPVYKAMMEKWSALVNCDIKGQIERWDNESASS